MSRRLHRIWLLPLLFLVGQAWALGLGDIRLSSALNQPLRAEIDLLAATPEELNNLTVQLAAAETFSRYDLARPLYLTRLQFQVVKSGSANGNYVRITSQEPITEPFITFLVEAVWSRGRLLREYTLLLDPPTFAPPPATESTQSVVAPSRATQTDSGQIQRPAEQTSRPQPAPQPVQAPVQSPQQSPTPATQPSAESAAAEPLPQAAAQATPQPVTDPASFNSTPGGDVAVVRGDTLWGITARTRPDSRLTFNQTMLAIFRANPDAFDGNINRLRAGATLRIPSADDIFRITRGDAFAEVQRQNQEWGGPAGASATPAPQPAAAVEPNLTLVPPDEDDLTLTDTSVDAAVPDLADDAEDAVFVDPTEQRISEIEALIEDQDALIEIPDNELAALRAELAELRGEAQPEPELTADEIDALEDDLIAAEEDAAEADGVAADVTETTAPAVVSRPARDEGIVDIILGYLGNFWVWIGAALLATVLVLVWFMRRAAGGGDADSTGMWTTLDDDSADNQSLTGTETLHAMPPNDETTILVEEQAPADDGFLVEPAFADDSLAENDAEPAAEVPESTASFEASPTDFDADPLAETGSAKGLEDTFSSETAINLDQSDPVAEADFHMAYGLYDQAADLINGALAADPGRQDLLAKLCEIYFVWGNRDAFVDAADRLKTALGGKADAEWDKIVIMGQQIAGDHEMFSGVSAGAMTKAVDLSFEGSDEDTGALDMDLDAAPDQDAGEVIDLGAETGQVGISPESSSIDFSFDEPDPLEVSATREMTDADTSEAPAADLSERTVETPTIEQQFEVLEATGELPAIKEPGNMPPATDATAEIDLDDLGLDLDSLADPSLAADVEDLEDTAQSQILDLGDDDATGSNLMTDDPDATGENQAPEEAFYDADQTGIQKGLNMAKAAGADEETMLASADDDVGEQTDANLDASLLDATGMTQVIGEDMAVDTGINAGPDIGDDEKTMMAPSLSADATLDSLVEEAETLLAPLDDDADDGEFDFAKTEALPKDVFSPDMADDETGNMEGLTGGTDMDLDLDDLTAALKVSEVGDTVNQARDDKTVEQPRVNPDSVDLDVGMSFDESDSSSTTQALAPDDLSGDLHDARTMTEVGTKLDLARAYVDMGDPGGARSILEEVLDEGDAGQKQQAQQLLDSLPA